MGDSAAPALDQVFGRDETDLLVVDDDEVRLESWKHPVHEHVWHLLPLDHREHLGVGGRQRRSNHQPVHSAAEQPADFCFLNPRVFF